MPKKTILVVDDDTNLRYTLAVILQRSGYQVTIAGYAGQALENLRTGHYDLVLLDLQLPDANGISLLSIIHDVYSSLPVLILTAHPSTKTALEAEDLHAWAYFIKPVEPGLLLETIRGILQQPPNHQNNNNITATNHYS